MNKNAVIFTVIFIVGICNAFPGSQLIQRDTMEQYHKNKFLDATDESLPAQEEYQQDMEEYDQHVSDNAHSPRISTLRAFLTEIFGFMLIRYITLREALLVYGHEIKEYVNAWLN